MEYVISHLMMFWKVLFESSYSQWLHPHFIISRERRDQTCPMIEPVTWFTRVPSFILIRSAGPEHEQITNLQTVTFTLLISYIISSIDMVYLNTLNAMCRLHNVLEEIINYAFHILNSVVINVHSNNYTLNKYHVNYRTIGKKCFIITPQINVHS